MQWLLSARGEWVECEVEGQIEDLGTFPTLDLALFDGRGVCGRRGVAGEDIEITTSRECGGMMPASY